MLTCDLRDGKLLQLDHYSASSFNLSRLLKIVIFSVLCDFLCFAFFAGFSWLIDWKFAHVLIVYNTYFTFANTGCFLQQMKISKLRTATADYNQKILLTYD